MEARPLTQAEADAAVERIGGWEKLRRDNAQAERSSRTLRAYLDSTPYDVDSVWVGAFENLLFVASSLDLLEEKLRSAGVDVQRAVTDKRIRPDLKVIFAL